MKEHSGYRKGVHMASATPSVQITKTQPDGHFRRHNIEGEELVKTFYINSAK